MSITDSDKLHTHHNPVSRETDTILGRGTIPEPSTPHIGKGVALVAQAPSFVYIYARIFQIAEMTLKFLRNTQKRSRMSTSPKPEDYGVGWICAVQTEYVVACESLDEEYPILPTSSPHDDNVYTLGRIGHHNVVIACLPKDKYGLTSATSAAKDMLRSFPSIRFGLMVGIGGGAPSEKHDIRLGDVVVSSPVGRTGGVIHYEFGKTMQNQKFERTGALDAPPTKLLTALHVVEALHQRKGHQIAESVSGMVNRNPRLRRKYQRPRADTDRLYHSAFVHPDHDQVCEVVCTGETAQLVQRDTASGTTR